MKKSSSKYREIIIAVALFVILDAGILFLNFFKSYEISRDAHAIQLASKQNTLNQQILHQLYQLRDDLLANNAIDDSMEKLTQSFSQFDETLDSFIYGGELMAQGQEQDSLLLDNNYSNNNQDLLTAIESIWKVYRARVSAVVYAVYDNNIDYNSLLIKTNKAIEVGRNHNNELLSLTTQFSQSVENKVQNKGAHLRTIQTAGIVLAIINFFVVLLHFLRKLRASDKKAEKSRQQTAEILETVNDGLFLIDSEFTILPQHSTSLKALLLQDKIANKNFLETIAPMVSGKTLSVVKQYIESMFSEHVEPELLVELNPLTEVEVHLTTQDGNFETRYFNFSFSPVYENNKLWHLLVIVRDISDKIILQHQLEKSKNESSQQLHDLISVIHLNHDMFLGFLFSLKKTLIQINDVLKKPAYLNKQYQKKVILIARITHQLKGEATLVGFTPLINSIHQLEDLISDMASQNILDGNDFLAITVELNALDQYVKSLSRLVRHVVGFKKDIIQQSSKNTLDHPQKSTQAIHQQSTQKLIEMSKKMAAQYNKSVTLNINAYQHADIPSELYETSQTIVIQLLRNAIVHGIEPMEIRKKLHKQPQATVTISTQKNNDKLWLKFRDDGQGIDLEAIKERLINNYGMNTLQVKAMTQPHLISYLFKPGFSTANDIDLNAGRGMGLELVKNIIKHNQAKLKIDFKHQAYTEFVICFPLLSHNNDDSNLTGLTHTAA